MGAAGVYGKRETGAKREAPLSRSGLKILFCPPPPSSSHPRLHTYSLCLSLSPSLARSSLPSSLFLFGYFVLSFSVSLCSRYFARSLVVSLILSFSLSVLRLHQTVALAINKKRKKKRKETTRAPRCGCLGSRIIRSGPWIVRRRENLRIPIHVSFALR